MEKVVVFDTSIGSCNLGDQIINAFFDEEMDFVLKNKFVLRLPTHLPPLHFYQQTERGTIYNFAKTSKYKYISGTNIISKNLIHPRPTWNINIFNCKIYKNSILVGCGAAFDTGRVNLYTKMLYKRILSKDYIHSARDEKTKKVLESMGFKAINTGCVTMWGLTSVVCKMIPKKKSDNVVFTLTDYNKDYKNDQLLIDILNKNYKNIYFWIQGTRDYDYLKTFDNTENIKIINPSVENYSNYLKSGKTDYVGTRLHAGIFAMRHHIRSIIIIVDNRARDMKKSYNLVAIERDDIGQLETLIKKPFETNVKIDEDRICKWKAQFR